MTNDLQTYVDAVADALAAGTAVAAWAAAQTPVRVLYVLNGEAPARQGQDTIPIPALVVMPAGFTGGQGAESIDRNVTVECRLREADYATPASATGTAVVYRKFAGHRALQSLVNAVLADITTALDSNDAAWTPTFEVDYQNDQWPALVAVITLSFTTQTTMPNE